MVLAKQGSNNFRSFLPVFEFLIILRVSYELENEMLSLRTSFKSDHQNNIVVKKLCWRRT